MKCPVCKTSTLEAKELPAGTEVGLSAQVCANCGGQWVAGAAYLLWLERQAQNLPETIPHDAAALVVTDSMKAKLCPECGRFLSRAKVGHGVSFELDRCPSCGGIWFDANEWESLVARNLHDDVHYIFSAAWQAKVLRERQRSAHDRLILAKLGEADWMEAQRVKTWLSDHPHRAEICALLLDEA